MILQWLLVLCTISIFFDDKLFISSTKRGKFPLKEIYTWKYSNFDFDSGPGILSNNGTPTSMVFIDVDQWRDKTFVTAIRQSRSEPASLFYVTNKTGPGGPLLHAYPDWNWGDVSNCNNIISVYRVAIDMCDRLWVLDTGKIGEEEVCPAKLLSFDLHTSKMIHKVVIPDNIAKNSTSGLGLLVTPIVRNLDIYCSRSIIYIADVEGYALIIYDGRRFQRLTSTVFDYDPAATTFTINGQNFTLTDGPVGMAISPVTLNLVFSPLSAFNMVSTSTHFLGLPGQPNLYKEYKDVLPTQASAKAFSREGILFFGLVDNTAIGCWNEFHPLTRDSIDIAAQDSEKLQFVSGMKIKGYFYNGEFRQTLYALSNRFQKVATGTLDTSETNFRILSASVYDLVKGTTCTRF